MQPISGKRIVIPRTFTVQIRHADGPHACGDFASIHWHTVALGPTATQLLWRLARTPPNQPVSVADLADDLGVKTGVVATQLDRLARRSYLDIDHANSQLVVRSNVPLVDAHYRQQRSADWKRRYQAWRDRNNT